MLAINKLPHALSIIGCLTLCLAATSLLAQQVERPSQSFNPTRTAPPSVHVPAQNARQLGQTIRQAQPSQFRDSAVRQTSYNFTDSDTSVRVPKILAGDKEILPKNDIITSMANHMRQRNQSKQQVDPNSLLAPQAKSAEEAALMRARASQATNNAPAVNQSEFRPAQTVPATATMPQTQSDFRSRTTAGSFQAPRLPAKNNTSQPKVAEFDLTPPQIDLPPTAQDTEKGQVSETVAAQLTSAPANELNEPVAQPNPNVYGPVAPQQESPSDLRTDQNSAVVNQDVAVQTPVAQTQTLPQAEPISTPAVQEPTTEQTSRVANQNAQRLASYEEGNQPSNSIRTVSNEISNVREQPQLSLRAPAIQVDAFGPRRIGVNKTGKYKIVVQNQSNFAAEDINVGIALPKWVDARNINVTSGSRGSEEGNDEQITKLVWNVKNIPANSSHTMMIDAVPTQAKMFDFGIEWAMVPKIASTNVDVTQPRLAMKISGPNKVQFGEKAIYEVTVNNPGTGTAENVVVKLPQALGGEQAPLHDILPGEEKKFQVELLARTAGELDLRTSAAAAGGLETAAGRKIIVTRAVLGIQIAGPPEKYSGTVGYYHVRVQNSGDAAARNVMASIALPPGVKYLGGIESVENEEGRVRWQIGTLDQGDQRDFKIKCELNSEGRLRFDAGIRGEGELAAAHMVETNVQTVADLVLSVADPKGPLPVGEETEYTIQIRNRGTKAADTVNLVMQFSRGIDPIKANGSESKIMPKEGQVIFAPIEKLAPGQEVEFTVTAIAGESGTHTFRAQLLCEAADSREVAEGTTKFFGEARSTTASSSNGFKPTDENQFKR